MPGDDGDGPGFEVAGFPTLNAFLWQPVAAGLWRQHEMFDGTYDIGDLLDVLEYLDTKEENMRRVRAHAAKGN
jgi:hypothetical protein